MTTNSKAIIITGDAQLKDIADRLSADPILAVDTESNGLHAYSEQVCLIQISSKTSDYIIDPFQIKDMSPLGRIFADPGTEKVFHDAEYDLICLLRDNGFRFVNIFDTMIAAKTLGRKKVSLTDLLGEEFDVTINKKYQRANWGKRPLTSQMLEYARMDTHLLIPLRDKLKQELHNKSMLQFAEDDFRVACNTEVHISSLEETFWKTKGLRHLKKQQAAILWELFIYRDKVASTRNLPPFKILENNTLIELAKRCTKHAKQLSAIPGMSFYNIKKHSAGILDAICRGSSSNPPVKSVENIDNRDFYYRLDKLKIWRNRTAKKSGVSAEVVLSRKLMHKLALENPKDRDSLKILMCDTPSRYLKYGKTILELINL
ncbi:MAG: ribonuclease D [PVC group bacterium]|nr:ribonuclease D [PVC group bacterium]